MLKKIEYVTRWYWLGNDVVWENEIGDFIPYIVGLLVKFQKKIVSFFLQ